MSAATPGLPASIDETLALLRERVLCRGPVARDRPVPEPSASAGRCFSKGEAGVGKTEIAKVLASSLGRRLIRLQCYEGLDVATAVYEWNYPAPDDGDPARRGGGRARQGPHRA